LILRMEPHQPWRHPISSRGPGGLGRNWPHDRPRIGQRRWGRPLRINLNGEVRCLALEHRNKRKSGSSQLYAYKTSSHLLGPTKEAQLATHSELGDKKKPANLTGWGTPASNPMNIDAGSSAFVTRLAKSEQGWHRFTLSKGLDGWGRLIRERRG
jgi:hypothetical protein